MRTLLFLPFTLVHYLIYFIWNLRWRAKGQVKVPAKVISVGNITVGGSGKTTMVGHIAGKLISRGEKVAVVARGYKRLNRLPTVVSDARPRAWEECGDEPAFLAKSIPGLKVYVNSDKTQAAKKAAEDGYRVIVVDDGFQHRNLYRDVDIVCLDAHDPVGNGLLLPSGKLREPPASLRRADVLVVINDNTSAKCENLPLPRGKLVFKARKTVVDVVSLDGEPARIQGRRVLGFCGLANPDSFFRLLQSVGCKVCKLVTFDDHHYYTGEDVKRLVRATNRNGAEIAVTTLKDAVKLENLWPEKPPLYSLRIAIDLEREEEFLQTIGV